MTAKQTALIQTAKLFAIAIAIGVLANVAFNYFTIVQIGTAFAVAVLAALVKMVYDVELSRAEHLAALNKMK
jgi:hypothetical protein